MTSINEPHFPKNLYEIIEEVYAIYKKNEVEMQANNSYFNVLLQIIKKYHLWPAMQIKKFKGKPNLVLLHNTYKNKNGNTYKELYEQCRSVVLDFSLSYNNNVVVTYANSIPERLNFEEYANIAEESDKYYEAYDGTMITVYCYNDEWQFGTTSCPDADSSRFSHPIKAHGNMLDDILFEYYRNNFTQEDINNTPAHEISIKIRKMFTDNLNPNMAYEFVIIHNENKHIVDYTHTFGENYKVLYHVNTKERVSLTEYDMSSSINQSLVDLGVKYPVQFANKTEAYNFMTSIETCYGIIVKKTTPTGIKLYKISTEKVKFREETDPCNPNVWINMLVVYMKNNAEYHINDYITHYASDIEFPVDNLGRSLNPTYLIHTAISTIKDNLFNLYISTTSYYNNYKRFKMNKELDKQFSPIIQYHLAQLRNQQVTIYTDKLITPANVYYYICQCNNVKNIKTLIQYFATYNVNDMPYINTMSPRTIMCFTVLNSLLS
jgi:hypothetical protein